MQGHQHHAKVYAVQGPKSSNDYPSFQLCDYLTGVSRYWPCWVHSRVLDGELRVELLKEVAAEVQDGMLLMWLFPLVA